MRQNTTMLVVVTLKRRRVSATAVGHLQVTKVFYSRKLYSVSHKIYQYKIQRDLLVVQYSNAVHD